MNADRKMPTGIDPGTSYSSLGSEDHPTERASCSAHPPKKRRFSLPRVAVVLPQAPTHSLSQPAYTYSGEGDQQEVDIDLEALTYYPVTESTYDCATHRSMRPEPVSIRPKRAIVRSDKLMRAAIRDIAKRRREKKRSLF